MRRGHIALAVALVLGGSAAHAQVYGGSSSRPWVSVDARAAYGMPLGKFADGPDDTYLENVFSATVPLHVGVGVHVLPDLTLGGYLERQLAQMNGLACEGLGCDGGNLRLGLSAQYLFPSHSIRPWVELTVGWERLAFSVARAGLTATYTGFDASLACGGDYPLGKGVFAGPVVGMSLGTYDHLLVEAPQGVGEEDLPRRAIHGFLMLGLRARFQL